MTLRSLIVCALLALCAVGGRAQSSRQFFTANPAKTAASSLPKGRPKSPQPSEPSNARDDDAGAPAAERAKPQFRVERLPLASGAELLTIFGRLDGMRGVNGNAPEVPLISVVRDTLNDSDTDNDRLRYVWMLTYTRPSLAKRFAAAVPFLYQQVGNQRLASKDAPKPIIDLANPKQQTWNRFFWMGLQNVLLDSYGIGLRASSRTYRRNVSDYRSGHVIQALSILDTYERLRQRSQNENEMLAFNIGGSERSTTKPIIDSVSNPLSIVAPAFTSGEMLEMRARLILSSKIFGGLASPGSFNDTVTSRVVSEIDNSGHNWELLRQRAEAEGLYFEPLSMPDGQPTHALLSIAKADLGAQSSREFHKRFLNIANPWNDERLRNWKGYSHIVYFDDANRQVSADTPGAHPVEMIPLALYGLDHPRIPALLIDFRHSLNPMKREMSRRVVSDVTKDILSVSSFGNLPYFVGRKVYNFVTGRRGMDINQPTRLQSYSELKLLLSFNSTIDPKLRNEIERRVQNVSLNPLNNDDEAEVQLAQQQYDALIDYAERADGLSAKIERDRRAEMVALRHKRAARVFFGVANILSFGRYIHREQATPQLETRLDNARRLQYHTQFLTGVAKSSAATDVAWDMTKVNRSLQFLATAGEDAPSGAAKAAAAIFRKTKDLGARHLCLEALSKINTRTARAELVRIYEYEPDSQMRAEVAARLRDAVDHDARIKPAEAKSLLNQLNQQ